MNHSSSVARNGTLNIGSNCYLIELVAIGFGWGLIGNGFGIGVGEQYIVCSVGCAVLGFGVNIFNHTAHTNTLLKQNLNLLLLTQLHHGHPLLCTNANPNFTPNQPPSQTKIGPIIFFSLQSPYSVAIHAAPFWC